VEFMQPMELMLRRRARLAIDEPGQNRPAVEHGRPAVLLAPVPQVGRRYAVKGERPPSRFARGEDDGVIARYDAYAQAFWAGRVKRNGR
jgi:hypothetical protein